MISGDLSANGGVTRAGRQVAICGAGGHARVVADVLSSQTPAVDIAGFLDDRPELHGTEILGRPVLGSPGSWMAKNSAEKADLIVGIGNNRDRERIAADIARTDFRLATAIHRSAQIGSDVSIGPGSVVMPNAVLNAGAVLGAHVIVNTSASVDHDCVIEDFCHISPGVNLAGGVTVGRGTHIGIGASVVPGVRIGEWATVGAGATVTKDVAPNTTVVGTRAVPVRLRRAAQ